MWGSAEGTRGGDGAEDLVSEPCRIRKADTDGLDLVLLDHDISFTAGARTMVVAKGTSVRLTSDRSHREMLTVDGSSEDYRRPLSDPSF